jgi:hypothetical protein
MIANECIRELGAGLGASLCEARKADFLRIPGFQKSLSGRLP